MSDYTAELFAAAKAAVESGDLDTLAEFLWQGSEEQAKAHAAYVKSLHGRGAASAVDSGGTDASATNKERHQ